MNSRSFSPTVLVAIVCVVACGGRHPPPAPPAPPPPAPSASAAPAPAVAQEFGSIDERDVDKAFKALTPKLQGCLEQGRQRVRMLAGDAKIFVRVEGAGHAKVTYLEESSLGDRETEKCLLAAIGSATWPTPVGGAAAEIRHSLGWPQGTERAPSAWDADKVMAVLRRTKKARADIDRCKASVRGAFRMTGYVRGSGRGGRFFAVGGAPPSSDGESKLDCVIHVVRDLTLPTPSGVAKVEFTL